MLVFMILASFLLPYAISNRIYVGTGTDRNGLYSSDDDGRNWRTIQSGYLNGNLKAIYVTDANIYIGDSSDSGDYGLYMSANNGTYMPWKKLTRMSTSSIFVLNDTKLYAGTNNDGLAISVDGGASWVKKTTADGLGSNCVKSVYVAEDVIYAATDGAGLSISADGGETWTIKQTAQGLPSALVNSVFAIGDSVFVATEGGLSMSKNRGQTWTTKNKLTGLECSSSENISSVVMSGNTIYASFNLGPTGRNCLGISSDGGNTWTYKKESDGVAAKGTSLFVLGAEIYMGDSENRKLSISRDNGNTWITQTISTSSIFVLPDKVVQSP